MRARYDERARTDELSIQNGIQTNASDFVLVKKLGHGEFGEVNLYEYNGQDPILQSIAKNQLITLKEFPGGIQNEEIQIEMDNMSHMLLKGNGSPNYLKGVPIKNAQGEVYALASEFLAYNEKKSATLEQFFAAGIADSDFDMDISIMLAQFVNSMASAQQSLHQAGMLHLDTAARNFMVGAPKRDAAGNVIEMSAVIIDYGLSRLKPDLTTVPIPNPKKAPLRWLNKKVYDTLECDIASDIFSNKATMLEMVGRAVGKSNHEILCIQPNDSNMDFIQNRRYENDNKVLEQFTSHAIQAADKNSEVLFFIGNYYAYLTKMPEGQTPQQVLAANQNKLLQANEKFLLNFNDRALSATNANDPEAVQRFLLNRDRLLQLEFNREFKNSKQFKELQSLNINNFTQYHGAHAKSEVMPAMEFVQGIVNTTKVLHEAGSHYSEINKPVKKEENNSQKQPMDSESVTLTDHTEVNTDSAKAQPKIEDIVTTAAKRARNMRSPSKKILDAVKNVFKPKKSEAKTTDPSLNAKASQDQLKTQNLSEIKLDLSMIKHSPTHDDISTPGAPRPNTPHNEAPEPSENDSRKFGRK